MTDRRKSIFNWNHINSNLSEDQMAELKTLYKFYYKKYWIFKACYKHFKKKNLICNIGATTLVITGEITLNPVILGIVTGADLILKGYSEFKNYNRKIEISKFIYTTYEKILCDLRSFMRGRIYIIEDFLNYLKVLDDVIIDMGLITSDKFEGRYNKKFTC